MSRSVKDAKLESRTSRAKLALKKYHFKGVSDGVALVYRRSGAASGTWSVRFLDNTGKYRRATLGEADDLPSQVADGVTVLDMQQAQDKARESAARLTNAVAGYTVAMAVADYLAWFERHKKSINETTATIQAHILPPFGAKEIVNLTEKEIRHWHEALANAAARIRTSKNTKRQRTKGAPRTKDQKRARQATANRVLTVLKAILNHALQEGKIGSGDAWTRVRPFKKVDEPRIRFLTADEATRLLNACETDLRQLVRAALLTGARYGELIGLKARDVNLDTGRIYIAESKSGKPRYVPLNREGITAFKRLAAGKTGDDPMFIRTTGALWGKNHHIRPLTAACKRASIKPAVRFHELRHTYASQLAQIGIPLLTIATLLGHSDTRITAKHYAHLADQTLQDAVEKLPEFGVDEETKVRAIR